jgi:hypothetical protein
MDRALAAVLRSRDINCVIDVGGNQGHFGQLVRTLGYTGRIVPFEPSPSSLPALSKLAAQDAQWEVRPIGYPLSREQPSCDCMKDPDSIRRYPRYLGSSGSVRRRSTRSTSIVRRSCTSSRRPGPTAARCRGGSADPSGRLICGLRGESCFIRRSRVNERDVRLKPRLGPMFPLGSSRAECKECLWRDLFSLVSRVSEGDPSHG